MSEPIRRPCYVAGTPRQSGDLQLGEVITTQGGMQTYTQYSGTAAANDVMIASGVAGRVRAVMPHTQIVSGQLTQFYDGHINTSGGPFAASGHKVVAIIPPPWNPAGSGQITPWTGEPLVFDSPFYSGLIAATRSGTPGFTVFYSTQASGVV